MPRPGIPMYFTIGEELFFQSTKYQKKYQIGNIREIKGSYTLKLVGIDRIDQALPLVGYSVFRLNNDPSKEPIEELEESTSIENINVESLIGYQVIDISGHSWGVITDAEIAGLNELLEVSEGEKIHHIPYHDEFIKEIRAEEGVVIIDPPDGLKELNE